MATTEWGFLIATDLFFGGISAGLFLLSVCAIFLRTNGEIRYPHVARFGALLAPWPVMAASAILMLDLGHWYRFYKLLLHFRPLSAMSMGTWILSSFIALSLVYCYASLEAGDRTRLFAMLPKRLGWLVRYNRDLSHLRRPLALIGVPLAIGVALYPGLLLGLIQARPFWNSPLVAQLFIVSAISTACAVLLLAGHIRGREPAADLGVLYSANGLLLAIELALVVSFVMYGVVSLQPTRYAMRLILGGPFTIWFWVCFVGLGVLVPFIVASRQLALRFGRSTRAPMPTAITIGATVLVVVGAYVLRCVFVFAGQSSSV
jgi:formate-dependent nitrite reductase membrane component NrfD